MPLSIYLFLCIYFFKIKGSLLGKQWFCGCFLFILYLFKLISFNCFLLFHTWQTSRHGRSRGHYLVSGCPGNHRHPTIVLPLHCELAVYCGCGCCGDSFWACTIQALVILQFYLHSCVLYVHHMWAWFHPDAVAAAWDLTLRLFSDITASEPPAAPVVTKPCAYKWQSPCILNLYIC